MIQWATNDGAKIAPGLTVHGLAPSLVTCRGFECVTSMGELYKVWYGMPDKPCNARNTRRHLTHRDRPNRIIIGV